MLEDTIPAEVFSGDIDVTTTFVSPVNGETLDVSGYVEFYKNGSHAVFIKDKFPISWGFNEEIFIAASAAMSKAAIAAKDTKDGIINLTQHAATAEQAVAGVIEPANKKLVQDLLTFDTLPDIEEIYEAAAMLAVAAGESGCKTAMIGGAPFLMSALERALIDADIKPVYAFSVRESVEKPDGNGGVLKTAVFKHVGFVEVDMS